MSSTDPIITHEELMDLHKALQLQDYFFDAYPHLEPLMDKLEKMAQCLHPYMAVTLVEVSTCRECGARV